MIFPKRRFLPLIATITVVVLTFQVAVARPFSTLITELEIQGEGSLPFGVGFADTTTRLELTATIPGVAGVGQSQMYTDGTAWAELAIFSSLFWSRDGGSSHGGFKLRSHSNGPLEWNAVFPSPLATMQFKQTESLVPSVPSAIDDVSGDGIIDFLTVTEWTATMHGPIVGTPSTFGVPDTYATALDGLFEGYLVDGSTGDKHPFSLALSGRIQIQQYSAPDATTGLGWLLLTALGVVGRIRNRHPHRAA